MNAATPRSTAFFKVAIRFLTETVNIQLLLLMDIAYTTTLIGIVNSLGNPLLEKFMRQHSKYEEFCLFVDAEGSILNPARERERESPLRANFEIKQHEEARWVLQQKGNKN